MREKIAKLINVKSVVTLLLVFVVCYKTCIGQMDIKQVYLVIIAFYFVTQLKELYGEIPIDVPVAPTTHGVEESK